MAEVLIGLGSNLGPREQILQRSVELLGGRPGIRVLAVSRWVTSRAVGGPPGQPDFLNGAVLLETSLAPEALLDRLQRIETQLGRFRTRRWGPRTLDLDLLLYGELVVDTPTLHIPHPAMAWRRFVLEPAAQVAGGMVHPVIGWTVQELLDHLRTAPPYLAIAGSSPESNIRLARQVAEQMGAELLSGWDFLKDFSTFPKAGRDAESVRGEAAFLGGTLSPDSRRLSSSTAPDATQSAGSVLKWLESLADITARDHPRWTTGRWVISDFWLPQGWKWAERFLDPEAQKDLQNLWDRASGRSLRPKLLVFLERGVLGTSPEVLDREASGMSSFGGEDALEELVKTAWKGPFLRIPGAGIPEAGPPEALPRESCSPEAIRLFQAAREVQAAMEAMQSL